MGAGDRVDGAVAHCSAFQQAFRLVVGEEGGFTANPSDPGNWTTGRCGVGICRGTKFGISAAAYPDLNIERLSIDEARAIYRRDYWDKIAGESLPSALALIVFDGAVNNGVHRAVMWLQQAAGVPADGVMGPVTVRAVQRAGGPLAALMAEAVALRLMFMVELPTWRDFGSGWARRLCRLPYLALTMEGG